MTIQSSPENNTEHLKHNQEIAVTIKSVLGDNVHPAVLGQNHLKKHPDCRDT